jgi:hypothetical protein
MQNFHVMSDKFKVFLKKEIKWINDTDTHFLGLNPVQ